MSVVEVIDGLAVVLLVLLFEIVFVAIVGSTLVIESALGVAI